MLLDWAKIHSIVGLIPVCSDLRNYANLKTVGGRMLVAFT